MARSDPFMWRVTRTDGVLGLAMFAAGVFLAVVSQDIPVNLGAQTLSARFFPQLLALLFCVFGLVLVLVPGPQAASDTLRSLLERRRVLLAGAIAVYFLLFRYIDFRVGTFVFMAVSMWLLGARKWVEVIGVALAVSIGTFVLFRYGFIVLLPTWG